MIDFDKVMIRLIIILKEKKKKEKILDKEIAHALHLHPKYFAVIKKRKKIPYESIAHFAKEFNINLNWILLAQNPRYFS